MTQTALTCSDARPGAIVLARHGEPALSRKVWLTSDEYRHWWADYEIGGLREGQVPPQALLETAANSALISSDKPRATQTAAALSGGREVAVDALFIEAPLPPPRLPAWFRLTPRWWGVVARFWWHAFDSHQGQESRRQAEARAERAADVLLERSANGQNVLVLAHGYFNHMIGRALKRRGWRCTLDQGFRYWSARRFERR